MAKILLVEDEINIASFIERGLKEFGHSVSVCHDGDTGWKILQDEPFDLLILDIIMPKINGMELCRLYRQMFGYQIPVIMLTALGTTEDIVKGLDAGADDYVTKPFSVTVLCKKVAAVFANLELRTPRHDLFDDGFLKIDFSEQSASLAGESLDFTPKEYRTLFLFVKNPRIILTKRQILEKLWDIDGDFVDEHTLTTIISRIRKKIETDERKYIKTAYGMGYQWIGGEPR